MEGERVLVTGAQGFLGRHLAKHLAGLGAEVVGMGLGEWESAWKDWGLSSWACCEITLENLRRFAGKPAEIFHCAGGSFVGFSMSNPLEDFQSTASSTAQVLEFMRLEAPRSILAYPSSAAVYGQVDLMPIPEEAPLRPVSPYGVHKMVAEELCRSYSRHFGIKTSLVRFFSLYGPGLRKQLLWDACEKIRLEAPVFFGTGMETRDWLHISDGVRLLCRAAERASEKCPVANGGAGYETTLKEAVGELFGHLGGVSPPTFTGAGTGVDPRRYRADISVAKSWGWCPSVNLKDGLKEYAEWYRASRA